MLHQPDRGLRAALRSLQKRLARPQRTGFEQLLDALPVLPLEEDAARHYAKIRTELERIGQPIGGNDLLIAAHALSMNLPVVTANAGEFSRVPGLMLENWLE